VLERTQILAVIDDDLAMTRARTELEDIYELVREARTSHALQRLAERPRLAAAVIAERLADGDGLALAHEIHARAPQLPIVLLSDQDARGALADAVAADVVVQIVRSNWRSGDLSVAVRRAWELASLRNECDALRRSMHRRIDALSILYDVSSAATEVGTYGEILETIMRALYRIVRFDLGGGLLVPDHGDPVLHLHCQEPCENELLQQARDRCLELLHSLGGPPVDESQLAVNLSGERLGAEGALAELIASTHIPLSVDGAPMGVIYLAARREGAFDADDEKLLYFLANRTSQAVARLSSRIHDERRRLSLMVESMADGLIMTDPHSEIVLINPSARRMLGIQAEDEPITRVYLKERLGFYPFDLVATRPVAPGSSDAQSLVREELKIGDKVLHSIVSPVRDKTGKLVGVVVVLRDITEAKELDRRKEEFVSVVSHELRTPLTSVTGALDIVLKEYVGTVNAKQRRYLQMARDSCARLNVIVDDLLDVARSEQGRMPMRFRPLPLDELSEECVDRYRAAAEAKNVDVRLRVEARNIRIVGDPDRLTQVLNNLLSNAIKFTPERGRIDIEVFGPSVAASHVGVSVYNNGDPIPPEARERVFDKFEQIQESSTRRVGGTGLGLAISRAIIEAHGGRIWVDPRDDGTKFVFTLPAAPETTEAEQVKDVKIAEEHPSVESGATVLLVGTDVYTKYILKGVLMTAGYEVLVAQETYEAVQLARQHRPSLVAVDAVSVAGESGALVEIIKHDPETKKAAVLVIDSDDQREKALSAGADEHVSKPIEADHFRRTCDRLIAEAEHAKSERVLVVDDDDAIRMICREVLENAGYAVREAADGQQALIEARRFRPDLMLLDVMMPDLDGFQTAQQFRAEPRTSMTPVIFLSARGETADKVRAFRLGAEDYVVKPFDAAELVARVSKALERRERELGASPTTQLPGANAIETEIERRLRKGQNQAFCYADLDNLKAFNDYYGYAKADGIIRQTGDLIRDVVKREGGPDDFIGHIAGDDFVFITTPERVDRVCQTILDTFDRLVPLYYNKVDRERGYIEAKDRYGTYRQFPIMSISVAAVTHVGGTSRSFAELAEAAAKGKKRAKEAPGSSYVRDGRVVVQGQPAPIVTITFR
jgi:signal transduction histidine kinase/DNA-binding response OmpR family regulator